MHVNAQIMMLEAMEGIEELIRVGGELLRDVLFADSRGIAVNAEHVLQKMMDALNDTVKSRPYDMKVNVRKSKAMVVSPG
jgi:Mg2+/Co2+ transporter CorC